VGVLDHTDHTRIEPGGKEFTMVNSVDAADDILTWAEGMYTTEAAVELLIRGFNGRFADVGYPWIQLNAKGGYWLDLEAIPPPSGCCPVGSGPTCSSQRRSVWAGPTATA